MQVEAPEKIRNLAVVGHNHTGKTTLTSALLYTSGVATRLNSVDDGHALTDYDPEEIERKISIGLATAYAPWKGHKINIVDCPGYGVFMTEIQSGMRAADSVLLLVDGHSGIEVTTERLWQAAAELSLPLMLHLSRMDRDQTNFGGLVEELQSRFGRTALPIQIPIGKDGGFEGVVDLVTQKAIRFERDGNGNGTVGDPPPELADAIKTWRTQLIEAVAESSDKLMEKFFEDGTLGPEDLLSGIPRAIARRRLFPISMSSAQHGIGGSALLDAVLDHMPSPVTASPFPATNVGGDPVEVSADSEAHFCGIVFKTINDPFSGRISLIRVVSGSLSGDTTAWNTRAEDGERLGALLHLQGKQAESTPTAVCGDIVGVAKLKITNSGDTLCDKQTPVHLGWITVPPPAMSFAVEPKSKGDEEKIGEAVHRLMDEDISLSAGRDEQTGESLLSGTGQLHVEIAVAKLLRRFKVEVILHPPKVPYREAIRRKAEGHGRHKKQSGGRGQFADCRITIEPLPRGEEFEFVDDIFGGSIPQNYRPAVEKGIIEAARQGYSTNFPVVDFRVRLQDGQFHDVDSSEMAFKIAGSLAFKDAMARAAPVLLEPMMQLEIVATEEFMGDIMGDLSQRRGRPQGMETRADGNQVIKALAPMAEMLDYARSLRALTQGRASFTMAYSHYEEVPKMVQDKVIAEHKAQQESEAS